ncbi:MAG: sigma-54-dependent Fis family transcriptional regulator [Deltaproteobacteria bacterium]|nr:sigma-54-dependent Fis family transcriptional regulator [Deltaproteobacteria bacterium]
MLLTLTTFTDRDNYDNMAQILIIDDDSFVAETISALILHLGHVPTTALSLQNGLQLAAAGNFDLILLDVSLPDGNGLKIIPQLTMLPHNPEVIIITGFGDTNGASLAISNGAWDYLVKGDSLNNIRLSLERALRYRESRRRQPEPVSLRRHGLIGESPAAAQLCNFIARAAAGLADILLSGATGTGKELAAHTIHHNSSRQHRQFVVVDCAALPLNLGESTLFGSRRGAYTGADRDRTGLVAEADGGTLFLDEIGELSLEQQKVMLRLLQEKAYRPLGETREIKSDFRLIAATNRNLENMVENGTFRRDLYYRLNALNYTLPTLAERLEDIDLLVPYFINRACRKSGIANKGFSPDLIETLKCHDWPGNIRELGQVIEAAITLAGTEGTLYSQHLANHLRINLTRLKIASCKPNPQPMPTLTLSEPLPALSEFRQRAELEYFTRLLQQTGHDFKEALKISGLSRSRFYDLIKQHQISLN